MRAKKHAICGNYFRILRPQRDAKWVPLWTQSGAGDLTQSATLTELNNVKKPEKAAFGSIKTGSFENQRISPCLPRGRVLASVTEDIR